MALGDNTQPILATWFPGADIGAQINNAYNALPTPGGTILLQGLASGACQAFTTPITFTTALKPVWLQGITVENTNGNVPQGSCLNYTPTTATTAIKIDWVGITGSGYVPQGGISNIIITNGTTYTNGGGGSSATGIATGTTNGGAGFAAFANMAIRGFGVGYLHSNTSAGAFGTQFSNVGFSYNNTGFSCTASGTEVLDFFGGIFGANGVPVSAAACNMKFQSVHFDSNSSPSSYTGATGAYVTYISPHFENLNVGAASCGANSAEYVTSSGPTIEIIGGDAIDDCNTGTNTVYWFNVQGVMVHGLLLGTSGRTPSSTVFVLNDGNNADVQVTLPSAGTALANLVIPSAGNIGASILSGHGINSRISSTQYRSANGVSNSSCTFTSGGGTGPSCSINAAAADSSGSLTLTTGTTPAALGTFTFTFGNSFGSSGSAICIFAPSDSAAGQWNARATIFDKTPGTANDLQNWDNNGVSLTGSTAYVVNYWCVGRN